MNYLPAICFALIPFGVWGQNIFFGQANTLFLSVTLLLFLSERNERTKINIWLRSAGVYLLLWMAYIFAMTMAGRLLPEWEPNMIISVVFIWAGMMFFLAVSQGSLPLSRWQDIICLVATVQAGLAILQTQGYDPVRFLLSFFVDVIGQMDFKTPVGTLGNQNFLAAFLAISLPFFFRDKWKWFIPVILFALILTKTTTAIGAAIIGVLFFYFGWKWALAGILPAFIIYATKYSGSVFTNARVEYWLDAWKSTSHSWQTLLFGWGPGITWRPGDMLHSEYANTFFSFGLVGLVILAGCIISACRTNKILLTAFIILCINMIGNHALHTAPTATLIIVIYALMEREKQEETSNGSRKREREVPVLHVSQGL